jgi:hypothetical protein
VEYASKRETLRLGPVSIALLAPGFLAERDRRLREQRSRTSEQFKHQYLIPTPEADKDLAGQARWAGSARRESEPRP